MWFPVPGGTVGMVQGRYAYHHYMQDKFNDDVSAAPIHAVINRSLITPWCYYDVIVCDVTMTSSFPDFLVSHKDGPLLTV